MTGDDEPRNRAMYTPGRAPVASPTTDDVPLFEGKTTYACVAYLAYEWAPVIEERLTAIEAETYDLADQVRGLGHRVTVALITTIAAIGVLVAYAVMLR